MFDCHIHSRVSFDAHDTALDMARAARDAGLKEICFTDHLDYDPRHTMGDLCFATEDYIREYGQLSLPGLTIRRGVEFGMTPDNQAQFREDLKRYPFDFVIGSVHFVDGWDVYYGGFWEGKTVHQAERQYLETVLSCVQAQDDFDVLGHLTFLSKAPAHPAPRCVPLEEHREVVDAILKTLADKGKGMELNTSGVDRCGGYLPTLDYFRRFRELGGTIVTVGSDAHQCRRVGQYTREACQALMDIFGHVCTYAERTPIFHTRME